MVHGLAASIRASQESETFDLGGQTAESIESAIRSAFSEPFPLDGMIRLTFVTGAGRLGRARYDDGAARAVTSALGSCGYGEDRGASCVVECGGSYKVQHDTGKNLKTVVVFPWVRKESGGGGADGDGAAAGGAEVPPLIPEDSPGYKIAASSMGVFGNMIASRCPSWSQKRGCLGSIEALKDMMAGIDSKLMGGAPLDGAEQAFYDAVVDLDEKEAHVRREMQGQVESGNITAFERDLLLEQNAERIASLGKDDKPTDKVLQRKELLENIEPVPPHRLRHEAEIRKMRKELAPLLELEERAKGRLLTVQETQTLARKDEILEEIAHLEEASRGWFEDDAAFESRVRASREVYDQRRRKKAANAATFASVVAKGQTPVNKWVLPGEAKGKPKAGFKKKSKIKGGAVFQAMMMDSSSDEEEESSVESEGSGDDNDGDNAPADSVAADVDDNTLADKVSVNDGVNTLGSDVTADRFDDEPSEKTATPTDKSEKKKSKKKRKKKKKSNKGSPPAEEPAYKQAESQETEERTAAVAQANGSIQTQIFGLLLAVLGWIARQLFGLMLAFLGWLVVLVFGKGKKRSGH